MSVLFHITAYIFIICPFLTITPPYAVLQDPNEYFNNKYTQLETDVPTVCLIAIVYSKANIHATAMLSKCTLVYTLT